MNFFITLDEQAAAKVGASNRIDGESAITVKVYQAFYTQNDKGTQTLHLGLQDETGATADISLHFVNGQGEKLPSYNMIQAILKISGLLGITQVNGNYTDFDYQSGGRVQKQGLIAPELIGKAFGAIFSKNYRLTKDNQGNVVERYSLDLFSVYNHHTMQFARQMIYNEQPKPGQIDQMLERAKQASEKSKANPYNPDKLVAKNNGYNAGFVTPQQAGYVVNHQGQMQPVSDDDMPF